MRTFFAFLLLAGLAFPTVLGSARPLQIRKGQLYISVAPRPDRKVMKDYWPFIVGVRNRSRKPQTLFAEIFLYRGKGSQSDRKRIALCTVHVELKGGRATRQIIQCFAKQKYTAWSFHVRKVWPFIAPPKRKKPKPGGPKQPAQP